MLVQTRIFGLHLILLGACVLAALASYLTTRPTHLPMIPTISYSVSYKCSPTFYYIFLSITTYSAGSIHRTLLISRKLATKKYRRTTIINNILRAKGKPMQQNVSKKTLRVIHLSSFASPLFLVLLALIPTTNAPFSEKDSSTGFHGLFGGSFFATSILHSGVTAHKIIPYFGNGHQFRASFYIGAVAAAIFQSGQWMKNLLPLEIVAFANLFEYTMVFNFIFYNILLSGPAKSMLRLHE